jgi:hypothetical protein
LGVHARAVSAKGTALAIAGGRLGRRLYNRDHPRNGCQPETARGSFSEGLA